MEKKKLGEYLNYWQVRGVKKKLWLNVNEMIISGLTKNILAVSPGPYSYRTIMPHSQMLLEFKMLKDNHMST